MLYEVITRWGESNHIKVDLTITGDAHLLSMEQQIVLVRSTQEALHNIQKHAQATDVSITLSYMEELTALDRITSYNVCYTKLLRLPRIRRTAALGVS